MQTPALTSIKLGAIINIAPNKGGPTIMETALIEESVPKASPCRFNAALPAKSLSIVTRKTGRLPCSKKYPIIKTGKSGTAIKKNPAATAIGHKKIIFFSLKTLNQKCLIPGF